MNPYQVEKMQEAIRALQAVENIATPYGATDDYCHELGRIVAGCAVARIGLEVALTYAKLTAEEQPVQ